MMVIVVVNSWSLEEDHFINFRRLACTSSVSGSWPGDQGPDAEALFMSSAHSQGCASQTLERWQQPSRGSE